jgi:hypothetical protein
MVPLTKQKNWHGGPFQLMKASTQTSEISKPIFFCVKLPMDSVTPSDQEYFSNLHIPLGFSDKNLVLLSTRLASMIKLSTPNSFTMKSSSLDTSRSNWRSKHLHIVFRIRATLFNNHIQCSRCDPVVDNVTWPTQDNVTKNTLISVTILPRHTQACPDINASGKMVI